MRTLWAVLIALLFAVPATAQNARDGRLIITVADQTSAVVPGATVTLTLQDVPNAPAITPATTSTQGVATFQALAQGRYTVRAEFEGFEVATVRDVRVRAGDNRQNVTLRLANLQDSITVGQDQASAASDRRGPTFGTVLTREQIDALSEDPEEAQRQLQELAGPGAVIRVDSFEGSALPPKSQIRMIRISRDQFAAENHSAGGLTIDIVTQPGLGPMRGNINTRLRDGSMTGRSPFVDKKGPERSQDYNLNLSGALVQGKTSFSLSLGGNTSFDTPNLNATNLDGTRSEALGLRRPRQGLNGSITVDHALTLDQTLRFGFNQSSNTARNLGIGDYDYIERAYETDGSNFGFRAQHVGPLGRRFFMNNRVQVTGNESETRSSVEAPTIRVLDAFTSGGAQLTGGTNQRRALVNSDLDYVRGIHSVRTGIALDGTWYRTDSTSNYLGTYTFENLEAFEQNRPRSYTRRLGDPNIRYFNLMGGFYVQDDIRVRRNLSLSPGLRYEVQTHVHDFNNLGPRFGVTWSPGTAGRTSLRASAGIFYDWLGTGTYEQTLRVDGFRQRELNIANPSYPDVDAESGIIPPVNRYLFGENVRLPRQVRFSGGAERAFGRARIGFTWAHMRGTSLRRGENLNAPVDGVRPNPEFGNVIRVVSDAGSRQNTMNVFFSVSLQRQNNPTNAAQIQAMLAAQRTAPLFDWRRASITTQYTNNWLRNNTDGDFWVSPTGTLDSEWGVANGDIRHRWILQVSSQFVRNLTTSFNLNASSGSPYTLQTGRDNNGDLIFNDRPDGVGRNTERASGQMSLNGNFNYSFTFGRTSANAPPQTGIVMLGGGAAPTVTSISVPQQGRYRVGVSVNATNITNRANYVGYSGVIGSPYFGRPRDVANPRRFDISVNFGF
jgi:hypothetical protein